MVTAIDVFWKVWVGGFCLFIVVFWFSTWILTKSGYMSAKNETYTRLMGEPVFFVQVLAKWFLIWPVLLMGGIAMFFQNPDK